MLQQCDPIGQINLGKEPHDIRDDIKKTFEEAFNLIDDNGNGVTDDRSELGATHSDDRCETMNSEIAKQQEPPPLVLQRGAFVNVSSPEQRIDNAEKRLRLSGESAGRPISFLISVDAAFITD